jgi:hypothetical protein
LQNLMQLYAQRTNIMLGDQYLVYDNMTLDPVATLLLGWNRMPLFMSAPGYEEERKFKIFIYFTMITAFIHILSYVLNSMAKL